MISEQGLALIKEFEGARLTAYPDPGTGGDPWTIGYGHTGGVKAVDTCTQEEADLWLLEDCSKAETCIDAHVIPELSENQRAALIAFIFNVGCGAFQGSSMLKLINAANFDAAQQEFKKWCHAGGKVMPGLERRRLAEAELFGTAA